MGTVAKFGQVPGVGANGIRPIRQPSWGRMIARPGTWGANAIRPYTDAKKRPGDCIKNRFGARNLGSFRLRKRTGEDGLHPYGDQNHTWVGFP